MSECIKCHSYDTNLFRADDGHFRKECLDCSYIGGPYVSSRILEQEDDKSSIKEDGNSQKCSSGQSTGGIFDY